MHPEHLRSRPHHPSAATRAAWLTILLALWVASRFPAPAAEGVAEEGFISLFDGRSLGGWHTAEPGWWSVEDGAITGRITPESPCATNQYLVWRDGELADFELKLVSRVRGQGALNNGFQFRSRVLPDGDVAGYQVDNNLQTDWLVRLYDEFGRHTLAFRGKRSVFDTEGKALTTDLAEGSGAPWFRLEEWHEYHLLCRGPSLTLRVDGRLAAEVEDHDRVRSDRRGVLALQLHSGPPTVAQFKDIRLKVLPPADPKAEPRWTHAESSRPRQAILTAALASWDLGVGGHGARHLLRLVGDAEFDVRAEGAGARPRATVADLRAAWFDAGSQLGPTGSTLTVYVRCRDPHGRWDHALLTQRGAQDTLNFGLQAGDTPETPGPDLLFAVHGTAGPARVGFPVSRIDPVAWHDLIGRYDGQALELWCDGILMARQEWAGGVLGRSEGPLLLGADNAGGKTGRAFTGEIEEAALWTRALSDEELAELQRVRTLKRTPR